MTGTLINAAAIVIGGISGIYLRKAMPERMIGIYFQSIGLFTIAIGISMVWNLQHFLIIVSSLVLGSITGEFLKLEDNAEKMGNFLKKKLKVGDSKFSEGLISAFLLFCVGSMTILGTIEEGLGKTPQLLYTKSMMDFFSSILLASAFGVGVVVSAIPLLIFQGSLTILAMQASSFFTSEMVLALTQVGGILLIGLGINILEIKKLRILNMIPSLLFVVLLIWIFS